MPVGAAFACDRHFSEEAVGRDEFYQDFLIPGGMRYITMARLQDDERRYTVMGLMREVGNRPFDDAERRGAQRVITHLDRACRLWSDTQQQRAAAAAGAHAAQASGFALLAVDAAGRIAYANANAERLLAEGGLPGQPRRPHRCGAQRRRRAAATTRSRGACERSRDQPCAVGPARPGRRGVAEHRAAGEQPARGTCRRARADHGRARDGSRCVRRRARWRDVRTQQRRERGRAGAVRRQDARRARAASGVSVATVRTQLRAVFEKTQTRRQAETCGCCSACLPRTADAPQRRRPAA